MKRNPVLTILVVGWRGGVGSVIVSESSMAESRSPSLLVVEDETDMCILMHDLLDGEGLEVVCATSDAAAYRALPGRKFSALLVDINLGRGTTGFDVARHARRLDSKVAVIYVTGGPPEAVALHGVRGAALVTKPFDRDDLVGALEEVGVLGQRTRDGDESTGAPVL
jgi:DNA-binding response OmpR family regulator